MKFKLFIVGILFTAFTVYLSSISISLEKFDGLSLSTIEALATGESTSPGCYVKTICYDHEGRVLGEIGCNGTVCSRGTNFVKCNGILTNC